MGVTSLYQDHRLGFLTIDSSSGDPVLRKELAAKAVGVTLLSLGHRLWFLIDSSTVDPGLSKELAAKAAGQKGSLYLVKTTGQGSL